LWCQNEALIATLNVWERTGAEWAADFFGLAYRVANEKFWQSARGYPAGAMLFADRPMTFQPHAGRQDNFHPVRQLMLNILALERIMQRRTASNRPALAHAA
jgi:hypothetical protein